MRKFAVIGHPIGHTMSPPIHKKLFALSGDTDIDYAVCDITKNDLEKRIVSLQELDGFNVTIPHKLAIIPFLQALSPVAQEYGSVNTVCCKDKNHLVGYNTDVDGFLRAIQSMQAPLNGTVLLIGSGGVARTFAIEAAKQKAQLSIAVRQSDLPAATQIKKDIEDRFADCTVKVLLLQDVSKPYDLIINATPVGMYPIQEYSPVGYSVLSKCKYLFDAVYNPIETKCMRMAKEAGAIVSGGMSMLVWQAVTAHEIWDDAHYKDGDIQQLIKEMEVMVKEQFR